MEGESDRDKDKQNEKVDRVIHDVKSREGERERKERQRERFRKIKR